MPTPQHITSATSPFQYHLEFTLKPGVDSVRAVHTTAALWETTISGMPNAATTDAVQPSGGSTSVVIGFGPRVWRDVAPHDYPANFTDAIAIPASDGRGVPATQRDLWVWLSGSSHAAVVESGIRVVDALADVADIAAEQLCMTHQDSRTWEGFIDGTENPGPFEVPSVTLVADDRPGAGGSTVLIQRWVNDGTADFHKLTPEEQEAVFGRSKRDSIQLDPLPPTSHVARNILLDGEEELHIYRRNISFGTVSEQGYIFVGFAADQSRVTRMLQQMYGLSSAPGTTPVVDALTKFSRPMSSSSYFVPSLESLSNVGAAPELD